MDERSHHPYPQQPQHADARGYQHAPDAPAPWPTFQQPQQPAPAQQQYAQPQYAQQQYAQPQAHDSQFQYSGGFVMPGAPSSHGAAMSAHGGMIGTPMQPSHPDAMPMLHGSGPTHAGQPPAHAAQVPLHAPPMPHGSAVLDPYAQPQAWAFPTPDGLQLVQPGTHRASTQVAVAAAAPGGGGAALKRRMKWETIVPAAAVACLVAAVALFISDFDRITGRETTLASSGSTTKAATEDAVPDGGGAEEADAVVSEATALFDAGRFAEARNLLHPMLDVEAPDPKVVALHGRVDAAATRNDALLAQLQRQRRAGRWTAVIGTIGQLEQLRPLSSNLVTLRRNARVAVKSAAAVSRAKALMGQGRDTAALAVIEQALKAGPNRQLQALREQISARRAAPSDTAGRGANGGGGSLQSTPTPAPNPGRVNANARPPANVAPGSIPPRPDAPNPVNANGTGASAVGGGAAAGGSAGSNCHTHDGVTECH